MMNRRVVITGLGVVSPVGIGKEAFWEALKGGESGIIRITSFDPSGFPSQIAGEVKDFVPERYINPEHLNRMSRFSQFAVAAAKMAAEDAGLQLDQYDPYRVGVCFGTAIGGGGSLAEETYNDFLAKGVEGVKPWACLEYSTHAPTSYISIELGIKGSSTTIASACSSGLDVVNWGWHEIRSGKADIIIVGGCEAPLSPLNFSTLCAVGVLSTQNDRPEKASRPYDLYRDGLVLSEGAAALVLEELEHALAREANIYAEILGFATASEGVHLRKCDLTGGILADAIEIALINAGLTKYEIDYINAHGNSMPDYDLSETNAFKRVFGKKAYNIPISSIKSMIGQSFGAGGATQVVSSCLTIQTSVIPPTINYEYPDPECDLDYVPNQARTARIKNVLMNAHSLGGMHSVLIIGKVEA